MRRPLQVSSGIETVQETGYCQRQNQDQQQRFDVHVDAP
jgi:hypothetical protein